MQILRRIPREVYGGAVLTALKRSADMSVEEAIEYKVRAGLLRGTVLINLLPVFPRLYILPGGTAKALSDMLFDLRRGQESWTSCPQRLPGASHPVSTRPAAAPSAQPPESAMVSPDAKGAASQVTYQIASAAVQYLPVTQKVMHAAFLASDDQHKQSSCDMALRQSSAFLQ